MKTFKLKKIITGISLFTVIFSVGTNVNAMNVGHQTNTNATEDYRNNIYYGALNPKIQSEIDQLHTLLSTTYKRYHRDNSQDDFRQILQHINCFLASYNDKPEVKQKIIRVIGISNFENGYIVNIFLFKNFFGESKSAINGKFQKLGFTSKAVKIELLLQTIGQFDKTECKRWSLRLPNQQSVHHNPQDVSSLINASKNNLSISNFGSFSGTSEERINVDNLVQPQNEDQLTNEILQNEQFLNSDANDKLDFLQPYNDNDDDPFMSFFNWDGFF